MAGKSRIKKAKKNAFFDMLYKFTGIVMAFFVRTVMIRYMGAQYTGLETLFSSVLSVLNIAELGFSSAIAFGLYKPLAVDDSDAVRKLLKFYRGVYRKVGCFVVAVGLLITPFVSFLIKKDVPQGVNIYVIFLFQLASTAIGYLFFAYKEVLLSASQRKDVISKVDIAIVATKSIIQILIIFILKNIYIYMICGVIFTLIRSIMMEVVTRKIYPDFYCYGDLSPSAKKEIFQQVKGLAIGRLNVASRNTFDSIILSIFMGLNAVTIYGNYYYIISGLIAALSVFTSAITAGVGDSIAVESVEKNYSDFNRMEYYYWLISAWATVCLVVLFQPWMKIWVGEKLMVPFHTMLLFVIYFYIGQLGKVRSVYANAMGIWWHLRKISLLEMILNIILNFLLGWFYEMDGILLATIVTVFVFSIIMVTKVVFDEFFKRSPLGFFRDMIINAMIVIGVAFVTYYFVYDVFHLEDRLIVAMIVCAIFPGAALLMISMIKKDNRKYIKRLMKDIRK